MNFTIIGTIIFILFGGCILFLITSFIFFRYILLSYKQKSERMTAEELYETLGAVISSECNILEKDIFAIHGNVLDAQEYENYYNYLTRKCINDLSDSFLYRASFVLHEDAIIEIVCRNVDVYLKSKLASGEPSISNNEEETA